MKQFDQLLETIANNKKNHFWIFFIILSLLSAFMLLTYNSIEAYPGWDYYFHIARLEALINGLKDGTFPIYIDYNIGNQYGYLCKAFYPDVILIPFAAIGVFTNSYVAYQVMLFTITILCGVFTYKAINTMYKNTFVATIGAILYTFSLYRLYDLFHRAALGEAISFTFVPLVILGLYYIIKGDYKKWYVLAIGFSLIIFSHVISSVLMFVTTIIILLFYIRPLIKEPKRILYLILSAIATLLIIAYFLYPMLEQMSSNKFYYETYEAALPQFFALGMVRIILGLVNGIFYTDDAFFVGTGSLLSILVCLRIFVRGKSAALRSVDIGVIIGLFFIFCVSRFFPWSYFPFTRMNFIQFPWRLYEFISYFFAVAGAYYLGLILKSNKKRFLAVGAIIGLTMLIMYTHSNDYRYIQSTHLPDTWSTANITNSFYLFGAEYVPYKVPSTTYIAERGSDSIRSTYKETKISNFNKQRGITTFDVKINNPETLELPLFFYKGYMAKLNDKAIQVTESNNGLVQIATEKSGRVEVYYVGTIIQKVSYYITIVSILALCIYIYLERRKRKHNLKTE